jgi:hypothetical protein
MHWSDGVHAPDARARGAHRERPVYVSPAAHLLLGAAVVDVVVILVFAFYGHRAGAAFVASVVLLGLLIGFCAVMSLPQRPRAGSLPETPPYGRPIYPSGAPTRPIGRRP